MGQRKTTPENRERILRVAAQLIREKGIEHTTLAHIAEAANISKGTLYYYYATKGDLIFDIADRHMNNMTSRVFRRLESSGSGQSPRTVFRLVLDTVMHSRSRGHTHVYLLQEALTQNPSLKARFVEEYHRWRGIIEEGLTRIYGDQREYTVMAQVLLTTLDGLVLQRLVGSDTVPIDDIAAFFEQAGALYQGLPRDESDSLS
ncbi:transcriptional regulator, TetR family [Alkalispirochaeta americana]|uniref:Transcriptional regulator, TetR family n=1 Tax=Alkalispirochaeta americana TaxID=159291 RepID=A0A1N6UZ18_9SPIO|nr:transcriptional regulator, TetR family [Alkalispirochaeta americana]